MNPLLLVDSYKIHHNKMYPEGMTKLYSNFTPRKSRMKEVDKIVFFGLQYFMQKYLVEDINRDFFSRPKFAIVNEYKRHCPVDTTHIEELHDLGYLPIKIKALPEGARVPIGVPCLTITNTHEKFGWLVNYLETLISAMLWQPTTSATIAYQYKKLLTKYAQETDKDNMAFIDWQGHDFSMRGMSSVESAILSGMGHLTSFTGTDTIPAIYQLERSYYADGLIGASVPATEHSVMCMGTKEAEIETFKRLLKLYPEGILSVVSDTWNLWDVLTKYLPVIKDEVMARNGKLVIRPDSGDPVDIICGLNTRPNSYFVGKDKKYYSQTYNERYKTFDEGKEISKPEIKGVIELLWDVFGGTVNEQGYKVLDPHIGAIYGDSITLDRAEQICERLKAKGFASTNIVLGIGSYTYQYNTRDTFGFAMKATYGEVEVLSGKNLSGGNEEYVVEAREIWKDPITDDGTKRSAKGLLKVEEVLMTDSLGKTHHSKYVLVDQVSKEEEETGALKCVFENGIIEKNYTLNDVKNNLKYHA